MLRRKFLPSAVGLASYFDTFSWLKSVAHSLIQRDIFTCRNVKNTDHLHSPLATSLCIQLSIETINDIFDPTPNFIQDFTRIVENNYLPSNMSKKYV